MLVQCASSRSRSTEVQSQTAVRLWRPVGDVSLTGHFFPDPHKTNVVLIPITHLSPINNTSPTGFVFRDAFRLNNSSKRKSSANALDCY